MTTTSPQLASWLHANISTIAASEDFDLIFTEIAELSRDIQRAVDVPVPLHRFGPCPEMVEADHDEDCDQRHPHQCDTELRGHHRASEVKCDACGTVHPTEGLFERQAEFAGGNSYTLKELTGTILPALGEYVPARTMQHWAATGRLNPTGYTATTATEDAEPRYLLDDIRTLWEQAMSEAPPAKTARRSK
jgi:hypothetical protein